MLKQQGVASPGGGRGRWALIETCVYRNIRIGLKRISSRTMQFECTLHNGRATSAFYCGIVRSYLGTATSSRQISDSPCDAPILHFTAFDPWTLTGCSRASRISVCMNTNVKYTRTALCMFKEFNIKSAIKLKTFC